MNGVYPGLQDVRIRSTPEISRRPNRLVVSWAQNRQVAGTTGLVVHEEIRGFKSVAPVVFLKSLLLINVVLQTMPIYILESGYINAQFRRSGYISEAIPIVLLRLSKVDACKGLHRALELLWSFKLCRFIYWNQDRLTLSSANQDIFLEAFPCS